MDVTDKNIPIDPKLLQKFDLMIKRCVQKKPRLDNLTNIEGPEGIGKTTFACMLAYYVHHKTGRPFSEKNVFANTQEAINFAQHTEEQIIIFDEPALDVLSAEWWKNVQKDLIKLLMVSRKKRHFFIFCLTKFYKFSEYVVVDRASCMIHLYEEPSNGQPHFVYIGKNFLETLYNDYRIRKKRNYKKYFMFRGTFPDVLDPAKKYNILSNFNLEEYEKRKDMAILSIGKKLKSEIKNLKGVIGKLKPPINTKRELCKQLNISVKTLSNWNEGIS